jgi:hypothetical protein
LKAFADSGLVESRRASERSIRVIVAVQQAAASARRALQGMIWLESGFP